MRRSREKTYHSDFIWPGFVDALSTLLLVVIFLLMIFFLGQFFLQVTLSGQNKELLQIESDLKTAQSIIADNKLLLEKRDNELMDLQSQYIEKVEDLREETKENQRKFTQITDQLALIKKLQSIRESLTHQVAQLQTAKDAYEKELSQLKLSQEQDGKKIEELNIALSEEQMKRLKAQEAFSSKETLLVDEKAALVLKISDLEKRLQVTTEQLAMLTKNLDLYKQDKEKQEAVIDDLTHQLNVALASKVEKLSKYRSDFFGRLREILGDKHANITIVGDRFVFQSEVLFPSGSATLQLAGKAQLIQLGQILKEITQEIPQDIPWILRIDGHTDVIPIATAKFPSNWELSQARAMSVVRFLIEQGIPPERLAATGFGQYHPLVAEDNKDAYFKNRRIEMKLTGR